MSARGVLSRGEGHPTDAALQEWSRFEETRISTATDGAMREHLADCGVCRKLVEDFRRMDALMHAFGSEPPVDRRPQRFRQAMIGLAIVTVIAVLLAWWL